MFAALVPTPPGERPGRGLPRDAFDAGKLGMWIFLATLSLLFASTLVLYAVFRIQHPEWRGADAPPLPAGLWTSTIVLIISSGTMSLAVAAIRRGLRARFLAAMIATTALGIAFLGLQYFNWRELFESGFALKLRTDLVPPDPEMIARQMPYNHFYLMTGLHAAHVIGGIVPLVWVTLRGLLGHYRAEACSGVRFCAMYWHFLDVVWLILFAVLMLTG